MGAVEEVRRWGREEVGLALWLYIPQSKRDGIKHNFPDELGFATHCKSAIVDFSDLPHTASRPLLTSVQHKIDGCIFF
jgi:hypothetical protein